LNQRCVCVCRCAMTSAGCCCCCSCRVDSRACLLVVLVVVDVLLGHSTALTVRHRHRSAHTGSSPPGTDHVVATRPPAAEFHESATHRLLHEPGADRRRQRHRAPAVERVVVPDYMWQLYRRQTRANRQHQQRHRHRVRRSAAAAAGVGGEMSAEQRVYSAEIIRSFVATTNSFSDDTVTPGQ